jgi:CheY-like chemotaxis protein
MTTAAGTAMTVLVVDDDELVRSTIRRLVMALGYTVIDVASGEAALQLLERGGVIDLVITDLVMPGGIDGMTLIARVAELRPGLPVILASGHEAPELPSPALNRAPVAWMQKPFTHAELRSRIESIFATTHPRSRAP